MCVIVGFTGNRQAASILLDGPCQNLNIEDMIQPAWLSVTEKI